MARPTLLTAELHAKFLGALRSTGSIRRACASIGVSEDSAARWRKTKPAFARDVASVIDEIVVAAEAALPWTFGRERTRLCAILREHRRSAPLPAA